MTKISFIYFDLGGVVIKDFSGSNKWEQIQQKLGVTDRIKNRFAEIWAEHRDRICIDYDIDNILPDFRTQLGLHIPEGYSLLQDFIDHFERNDNIWPIIQDASQKAPIGLITNVYPRMLDAIKSAGLLPDISWVNIIDSSILKIQKPDIGIYQEAQERAGVPPQQILFIDNKPEFLTPPSQLGWQTYLYDSSNYDRSNADLATFLNLQLPGL